MSNRYIIINNPILYADSAAQIQQQVNNIYNSISSISYTPGKISMFEDFGINCGDIIQVDGNTFYVMKKSISASGVELECVGSQERNETSSLNEDIQALRGKSVSMKRDIESFQQTYGDDYAGLQSQITQTAGELRSQISSTDGRVNTVSQTLDGVLFTNGQGQTLIDGAKIETSRINAADLQLSGVITWGDLDSSVQNRISDDDSYTDSDVKRYLRATYGIQHTNIDGTTLAAPKVMGGEIYAATLYAGQALNNGGSYVQLDSNGLMFINDNDNEEAVFGKHQYSLGGFTANIGLELGNTVPACFYKFWVPSDTTNFSQGNHIWIGNNDLSKGLSINLTAGTYKFIGLTPGAKG
jgi:hypothetical protein